MAKQASEIMTEQVITITEETDLQEISGLMVKHGIKNLPVLKDGRLVGVVSRADIIKTLIS
jgi:CBS domain-containing protein